MKTKLHFDNIIYRLQKAGGISNYWQEITSRIIQTSSYQIQQTEGNRLTRYLPVLSTADIFHSSYYRQPLSFNKTKTVVTIYDFIYEFGFIKTIGKEINIRQTSKAIQNADAIICISENTKKDFLLLYPELSDRHYIYVTKLGTSLTNNYIDRELASLKINELIKQRKEQYILFVGGRKYHKNFNVALLAFAESYLPKSDYLMVCVGSKFSDSEEEAIANLELQQKVIVLENVTSYDLQILYQNAFALLYPSLYEGFGLPPLEAMSCGCPVIASNTSSIPEVVSNAGILVDPKNIDEIKLALEAFLDSNYRHSYIQKGLARAKLFSWDEAAQQHIEIYKALVR
jgi:glycosyltransferase involved in cell wall biosynthesis